jgi:hypothetical protein
MSSGSSGQGILFLVSIMDEDLARVVFRFSWDLKWVLQENVLIVYFSGLKISSNNVYNFPAI